ncbi:SCNNG-like protein, partial [Mya arenaria]
WPVEHSVEVRAVPNLKFPSVTICNINPLKACTLKGGEFEAIEDILELDDKDMLFDDYKNDRMREWLEDSVDTDNGTKNDYDDDEFWSNYMQQRSFNKWNALENDTETAEQFYADMDDSHTAKLAYATMAATLRTDEFKKYGHQIEDLLISCVYQGMACSPKNFTYLRNNLYGNCYTFNAFDNGHDSLSTNYAGPLMGLTLDLNIEQDEYIAALAPDAGVKVVIHERGTYPIPEDEGLSLSPHRKTSISMEKASITRLPPPHADCGTAGVGVENYYTRDFGTAYGKETCFKSCLQTQFNDLCGCSSPFFYVPPEFSPHLLSKISKSTSSFMDDERRSNSG